MEVMGMEASLRPIQISQLRISYKLGKLGTSPLNRNPAQLQFILVKQSVGNHRE